MFEKGLLNQKITMCLTKTENYEKEKKHEYNLYYQENTVKGQETKGPQLIRQAWKKYTNNSISLSVSSKMIIQIILAESIFGSNAECEYTKLIGKKHLNICDQKTSFMETNLNISKLQSFLLLSVLSHGLILESRCGVTRED